MYETLKIINIIGMAVAAVNIFLVSGGRSFAGREKLLLAAASLFIHVTGVFLEFTSVTFDGALNALKVQYLVAGNSALFLMMFLFEYCGRKCPKPLWISLLCVNLLIFWLVATSTEHTLYYSSMEYVHEGLYPHFVLKKGIFYYVHLSALGVITAISLFTAVRHYRKRTGSVGREALFMALAVCLPCVVKIAHGMGFLGVYDPTMLATIISSMLLILSVSRYNMAGMEQLGKEQFVDEMQEGFIMLDKDFGLVSANKTAMELFGELSGAKTGDRITQLAEQSTLKIVTSVTSETAIKGRHYEFRATTLSNGGEKTGYMICAFDVTSAHRSYIKMTELKERAELASKAKEIFLANMSHEIRTPMNAIVGMSSLLLETENLPENAKEYVQTIQTSSDTLIGIINDVLDFSKIESGKVEVGSEAYEIKDVTHDIYSIMKGRAEQKGLDFSVELSDEVPARLIGDKMRIKQVMLNLLGNAVKFTERGSVSIKIGWIADDAETGRLSVMVEDTGIGIKESDYSRLFVDFSRIEGKRTNYIEGTGLGLSICKRFLDMMGGSISVESVFGEGSRFSFEVPQGVCRESSEAEAQSAGYSKAEGVLDGVFIMFVDDNDTNLKVTKSILEAIGAVPILRSDGESALEYIRAGQKLPKIILMDYMMPGMDGIQTAAEIRKLGEYGKGVPIIAVTADALKGEKERFLNNGFDGYLSKPINLQKMKSYLEQFAPSRSSDARLSLLRKNLGDAFDVDEAASRCGGISRYLSELEAFVRDSDLHVSAMEHCRQKGNTELYRQEAAAMKRLAVRLGCKRLENMSGAMVQADEEFIENNFGVYYKFAVRLQIQVKQALEQEKTGEGKPERRV